MFLPLFICANVKIGKKRETRTLMSDGHVKVEKYDSLGVLIEEQFFVQEDSGLISDGCMKAFYKNRNVK